MIFELPPRHTKSEHVSRHFPAWFLGRNPLGEVIHASHTGVFAEKFGRDVRDIITSNVHQNVFPNTKIRKDQNSKTDWKLESGGSYIARGIGGATTGEGADLFVVDDPFKDWKDANSLVMLENVWDWYASVATTRLAPDGRIVLMMTRWNTEDLIGRVIEQDGLVENGGKWHRCRLPAIADGSVELHPLDPRENKGEALWPARFPLEKLEEKRENGVRKFAAMYQQDPIRAMGNVFKKEDFRYFALSDLNPQDFDVGIFVDPAFSTRESSDDVAIGTVARHKISKEIYILDALGEPLVDSAAFNYIISSAEKWKAAGWGVRFISNEIATINEDQQLFMKNLDRRMREEGKIFMLLPFNPRGWGKKEDRIKSSLEPYFDRHAIHFRCDDTGNPAWRKIEEQFLKFPVSQKDDLIDMISQAAIVFDERGDDGNEEEKRGAEIMLALANAQPNYAG